MSADRPWERSVRAFPLVQMSSLRLQEAKFFEAVVVCPACSQSAALVVQFAAPPSDDPAVQKDLDAEEGSLEGEDVEGSLVPEVGHSSLEVAVENPCHIQAPHQAPLGNHGARLAFGSETDSGTHSAVAGRDSRQIVRAVEDEDRSFETG